MLAVFMVQKNNDEERLARIEHMVEALQRADAARKRQATTLNVVTGALLLVNVAASMLPLRASRKA
jgi:hypothetical protein